MYNFGFFFKLILTYFFNILLKMIIKESFKYYILYIIYMSSKIVQSIAGLASLLYYYNTKIKYICNAMLHATFYVCTALSYPIRKKQNKKYRDDFSYIQYTYVLFFELWIYPLHWYTYMKKDKSQEPRNWNCYAIYIPILWFK